MIEVQHLTKRFGEVTAVDDLTFAAPPGVVTGFLGPNGSGKTTTLRAIAGLDRPTAGEVRVEGVPIAQHPSAMRSLGVLLDARSVHPGRSALDHLRALAASNGIGERRVHDVVELTGIASVARRRAGTYSLGMSQRLGIAAALLGEPRALILDEPINGLDPEGVIWVRRLLRELAVEGRTVLLSSHLMSEMEHTADRIVLIGRGRLVAEGSIAELLERTGADTLEDAYVALSHPSVQYRAGELPAA